MYLVGFAFGPVVLSPIAEDYGRRWTFAICLALTYIFQIPIALAPNLTALVICRFIAGFIASPIFNVSSMCGASNVL
jgi:MFS family permease